MKSKLQSVDSTMIKIKTVGNNGEHEEQRPRSAGRRYRPAHDKANAILSVNGYVDITLPGGTAADLQMHSVNGEAYTDWDIEIDKDASATLPMGGPNMNMFNLEGTINGGGTPISIQSVNGDIYLRKKN